MSYDLKPSNIIVSLPDNKAWEVLQNFDVVDIKQGWGFLSGREHKPLAKENKFSPFSLIRNLYLRAFTFPVANLFSNFSEEGGD